MRTPLVLAVLVAVACASSAGASCLRMVDGKCVDNAPADDPFSRFLKKYAANPDDAPDNLVVKYKAQLSDPEKYPPQYNYIAARISNRLPLAEKRVEFAKFIQAAAADPNSITDADALKYRDMLPAAWAVNETAVMNPYRERFRAAMLKMADRIKTIDAGAAPSNQPSPATTSSDPKPKPKTDVPPPAPSGLTKEGPQPTEGSATNNDQTLPPALSGGKADDWPQTAGNWPPAPEPAGGAENTNDANAVARGAGSAGGAAAGAAKASAMAGALKSSISDDGGAAGPAGSGPGRGGTGKPQAPAPARSATEARLDGRNQELAGETRRNVAAPRLDQLNGDYRRDPADPKFKDTAPTLYRGGTLKSDADLRTFAFTRHCQPPDDCNPHAAYPYSSGELVHAETLNKMPLGGGKTAATGKLEEKKKDSSPAAKQRLKDLWAKIGESLAQARTAHNPESEKMAVHRGLGGRLGEILARLAGKNRSSKNGDDSGVAAGRPGDRGYASAAAVSVPGSRTPAGNPGGAAASQRAPDAAAIDGAEGAFNPLKWVFVVLAVAVGGLALWLFRREN